MESVSTFSSEFFLDLTLTNIDKQMFLERLDNIMEKQLDDRVVNENYTFFEERKQVLRKSLQLCRLMNLKPITFASFTCIFDRITSRFKLSRETMEKISPVILGLCIKVNENALIPYSFISKFWGVRETQGDLLNGIEKTILKEINFRIKRVTPFDFLELFLMIKNVHTFPTNPASKNTEKSSTFANSVWEIFYVISMDYRINEYSSLCIAVVVIMIARHQMGASVLIPDQLMSLIKISPQKLTPVFKKFLLSSTAFVNSP